MTISSEQNKAVFAGNGSTTVFSTVFTFSANTEVTVTRLITATGVETVFTEGTEYTLTGAGTGAAGSVTIATSPSDFTPASGTKIIIQLKPDFTQPTDLPRGGTVSPADTLEPMHDSRVRQMLRLKDDVDRALKLPIDETSAVTMPVATLRAGKILSFDSTTGAPQVDQEIGVFRSNWAAAVAYNERDLVKDSGTGNIFIANTAHTSSGSLPITGNSDASKWDLLVDASSATSSSSSASTSAAAANTSKVAAEAAQAAAETAQTAAETAQTNSANSATASANSATSSAASATSAAASFDSFDDRFLGAKSSDPSVDNDGSALIDGCLYFDSTNNVMKVFDLGTTTWLRTTPTSSDQTAINTVNANASNINTVAGVSANVTTVAGISGNVTTVAGISSNVTAVAGDATDIGTVATDLAGADNIGTVAGSISNVNTTAGSIGNVNIAAGAISSINTVAADPLKTDISTVAGLSTQVSAVAAQHLGYQFNTSTTTSSDPGSGKFTLNSGTLSSVSQIAVSDLDTDGTNHQNYLNYFDDSTNVTSKAKIVFRSGDRDTAWFNVTSLSDETGFVKFNVTFISGSASSVPFSSNELCFLGFSRTGDKGADGAGSGDVNGPGSATDDAIARFNTTTGKLLQNSGATIDDSGNITTPGIKVTGSTQHGVLVGGGSSTVAQSIPLGSANQVLTSNGAGSAATFQDTQGGPGVSSSGTDEFIRENAATISGNVSITAARNAFSAGPITIAGSATVTIPANSRYHIIG